MKKFAFSLLLLILIFPKFCSGIDPVAEYRTFVGSNDELYRWSSSIGGNSIVFLTSKQDYKDERHDGAVPAWTAYFMTGNGSGYVKIKGLKDSKGISDVSDVAVDPEKMFIGLIAQLEKQGIITVQVDRPRKTEPVAYIYAYTLEGEYMRKTLLSQYDPDKGSNPVYDQYLTEIKRTKVQLEEVNP